MRFDFYTVEVLDLTPYAGVRGGAVCWLYAFGVLILIWMFTISKI